MIYKKRVIIFAGTTEGRLLAERLAASGVEVTACVATEYGEKLMRSQSCLQVHSGRMDAEEMADFLQQKMPHLVVDATHPYAQIVSETVKKVCEKLHMEHVRLLRPAGAVLPADDRIHTVEDAKAAAELAERMNGNIFLTTGSKELAVFVDTISDFSRLYARVLSTEETFGICKELGLAGRQLICMQGPFSEELNRAMYAHVDAKILVTKESGDAGGFSDKVQAALALGMQCIVIQRPQEQGLSFEQVCERLGVSGKATCSIMTDPPGVVTGSLSVNMSGIENDSSTEGTLVLVGIGMGTTEQMTLEARHALEQAQVIFGAKRMLQAVCDFQAQKVCEYRKEAIVAYLSEHLLIKKAAVLFSGDVGFYSGADAFGEHLDCGENCFQVRRIAGLSSVNYFAAKLGVAWQDINLCSVHGRNVNLPAQIMQNRKVFSLLNGGEQLAEIAKQLSDRGLAEIRLSVGYDLGYETEEIWRGSVSEFLNRPMRKGLCVALFENEHATVWMREDAGCETTDDAKTCQTEPCSVHQTTGNLPDAAFVRGAVPLSKEEIRAVALSKLRLTADAVCYDIGAGTGGMTMDMARFVPDGTVYAFEKKDEACELLRANAQKFQLKNVQILQGSAPEILADMEPPTHAFIGGSGGRLREIVELLLEKNPCMRIVIDAVTLETVGEANAILKTLPVKDVDIVSITVAKAKTAGAYHLMESMNPVYIYSFTGAGKESKERNIEQSADQNIVRKQIPRLILAAPHSGSGKTMITIGLLAALQKRGISLASFKCGPDYIDPMFHSRVLGLPTRNLDTYFTDRATTRMLFAEGQTEETELALIEGVMGYYDGAGLSTDTGSTYELAKTLDAPVVLIIDASGMSLSAVALLRGFLEYRKPSRIVGVLFNRMSKQVYEAIRPEVEALGIRPCGYVPKLSGMELPSRHLGLVTPEELTDLKSYTEKLAVQMEETVDLGALLSLANAAPEFTWEPMELPRLSRPLSVSVAKDEAFCFLYEDNLNYLRRIGAHVQFFSPMHEEQIPEKTDVLLLTGGYPELYAERLSANTAMRRSIQKAMEDGVYAIAECGGFLYLTETLEDMEGHAYPMVGRIPAKAFQTKKLGRFGYVELTPKAAGEKIRGHEFHYFDTTDNGSGFLAKKPFRDVMWECMHVSEQGLIGFPHLYYYSNPKFLAERLERYIQVCESYGWYHSV